MSVTHEQRPIAVRPLRTAFDTAGAPVTVATPSCCSCCCCCCLATTALAVGVSAGAAYEVAHERERNPAGAILLAILAVPAAIGTMVLIANNGGDQAAPIIAAGGAAFVAVMALAFAAASADAATVGRNTALAVLLVVMFAGLVMVEVLLALVTLFLFELAALATPFLGWKLGRWWGRAWPATSGPPTDLR